MKGYLPIPSVDGTDTEAVRLINEVVTVINRDGPKRDNSAVVYIGHRHYHAMRIIVAGDPAQILRDRFWDWILVRVMKEDYIRVI